MNELVCKTHKAPIGQKNLEKASSHLFKKLKKRQSCSFGCKKNIGEIYCEECNSFMCKACIGNMLADVNEGEGLTFSKIACKNSHPINRDAIKSINQAAYNILNKEEKKKSKRKQDESDQELSEKEESPIEDNSEEDRESETKKKSYICSMPDCGKKHDGYVCDCSASICFNCLQSPLRDIASNIDLKLSDLGCPVCSKAVNEDFIKAKFKDLYNKIYQREKNEDDEEEEKKEVGSPDNEEENPSSDEDTPMKKCCICKTEETNFKNQICGCYVCTKCLKKKMSSGKKPTCACGLLVAPKFCFIADQKKALKLYETTK